MSVLLAVGLAVWPVAASAEADPGDTTAFTWPPCSALVAVRPLETEASGPSRGNDGFDRADEGRIVGEMEPASRTSVDLWRRGACASREASLVLRLAPLPRARSAGEGQTRHSPRSAADPGGVARAPGRPECAMRIARSPDVDPGSYIIVRGAIDPGAVIEANCAD